MQISRHFTKPGNPLKGIGFVRRTAAINNRDGSKVFNNDNVVVPDFWSQTATDILAQKYFRKTGVDHNHANSLYNSKYSREWASSLDHPNGIGYENDLRQTAHRIAGCWASWGERLGYFEEKDAQAFYDEILYLLVSQSMAPNSPQWFNTGLYWAYGIAGEPQGHYYVDPETGELKSSQNGYEHPQTSACFIQSLKDDLVNAGGIFDLFVREARLFKHGSGSGANYSDLRAKDELLSGGGKSSGVLSWMKVGDAGAGGIKSGGTTRRAARIIILNADHPEVENFANWKVEEERKVAALVAGSNLLRNTWKELREAAPTGDTSEANGELKKALRKARKNLVPAGFISQCLNRIKQLDFEEDIKQYDMDWEGEAYQTVTGMNANNTVRVTDDFIHALKKGESWDLKRRTDGSVCKTIPAASLMNKIVKAAWLCADPGMQFDTTINDWHTTPKAGRINGSNPCGEFTYLDDTSCNLASLNLCASPFLKDSEFRVDEFTHAVSLVTIALELSVAFSQFPSPNIATKSYEYRPTGLGYANLGSLLMRQGIPYDSELGRNWAAALTAIMSGQAYLTSAQLAEQLGPFPGYDAETMLRVINNHRVAAYNGEGGYTGVTTPPVGLKPLYRGPRQLVRLARELWDQAVALGEKVGFRNSQVTLLAPTGTIGLVMGCDTTGVEPDFSLVKYKKLAGGGLVKLVNESIPAALLKLGYTDSEIKDITDYISKNSTVEGAPGIKEEHLPVFDCATQCGEIGKRFILPLGHVSMMAAVQPFLSGAISKTINLPAESTIQDIYDIYLQAWEYGLKSVTVYRDGSKFAQALASNAALLEGTDEGEVEELTDPSTSKERKVAILSEALARGYRKHLPNRCRGIRQKAKVGGHSVYIHAGEYEDGKLGEVFIDVSREGATLRSLANCFAVSISLGLQYGVPLEEYVDAFCFTKFEPSGMVQGSAYIKNATSLVDYVFRELAVNYLDRYDLAHVQPEDKTTKEEVKPAKSETTANRKKHNVEDSRAKGYTGDPCSSCGSMQVVRTGTCSCCQDCGSTTGCS